MPKSLHNYIKEATIERQHKKPVVQQVVEAKVKDADEKKSSLKEYISDVAKNKVVEQPVVEAALPPVLTVVKNTVEIEIPEVETKSQIVENIAVEQPKVTEEVDFNSTLVSYLQESIDSLRDVILEQQNTQVMLTNVITGLMESLELQNKLTEERFKNIDTQLSESAKVIFEASEKLQELAVREINIPAPVVNVSLSEQKRVTKTVDRDENGLITKITEDTEQSVSQDK